MADISNKPIDSSSMNQDHELQIRHKAGMINITDPDMLSAGSDPIDKHPIW